MKHNHFKHKLRTLGAVVVLLFIGLAASAQQITVSGLIKDATNGEPIFGANILERGTTNGTISNMDGEFTLTVASNATLEIKYIGYQPMQVSVAGKRNLVIQLQEDAIALNEVVAIGYGTVRKNDATGSVTAIKPDKLNRGLTTNAQDLITGKIAGVVVTSGGGTPGSGATIRIRGGSSLSASNDPLIVIDGLAMDNEGIKGVANPLSTINPNDIETYTVLKDASATAIYGSRASNGVIIITTKKGEKGAKPRVSYDGNMSVSTVKKSQEVLTGDEFRDLVNRMYPGSATDAAVNRSDSIIRSRLGTSNTDWYGEIFRPAISHDHNINVAGGYKDIPYRVSAGYTNQQGIIKTSSFERFTGAISLSPAFFEDHLKVNLNAKGMVVKNRYADGGVVGAASSMDPTQPVRSTDPEFARFGGYWQWLWADGNANTNATRNPVATLEQKTDVANSRDFIGSADFDYKFHFFPDLRAHLNLGMESSFGRQELFIDSVAASDSPYGREGWDEISKSNKSLNFYLQYSKELENHNFDFMAGYEWQHFFREGSSEYQGIVRNILDTVSNEMVGYNRVRNTFKTESYLVSFFGRFNYSYAGRYLATFTLRNDLSSRFSKENRSGLFPAAALAWKINEEGFLKDRDIFSDLKLRLGYGVTGQQNINQGDYPYIPVYTINKEGAYYPFGDTYYPTSRPDAYNTNLKWEETSTWNVGLDMGVMNNRITASLDYYFRETTNLINVVSVPAGTNFRNRVISNVGSLQNEGLEFSINAKPIARRDLTWDVNYNITFNKNLITKLTTGSEEDYNIQLGGLFQGYVQAHAVGYPSNSFFVYQQVYDSVGKPIEGQFVNRDNNFDQAGQPIINEQDRYYYKSMHPDVTMGLSSKVIYKNFDFGFTLRASIGNYMYNGVAAGTLNVGRTGIWNPLEFFSNKPVTSFDANFSGTSSLNYLSDYYVQDASFLRCDNITLGYSFKSMYKVISSGRVYATVQNPFIITRYKGIDPEIFGGIDNNIYPRPMITVVGVNLNF